MLISSYSVLGTEPIAFEDITITLTFLRSVANDETSRLSATSPYGMASSATLGNHDGRASKKLSLQLGANYSARAAFDLYWPYCFVQLIKSSTHRLLWYSNPVCSNIRDNWRPLTELHILRWTSATIRSSFCPSHPQKTRQYYHLLPSKQGSSDDYGSGSAWAHSFCRQVHISCICALKLTTDPLELIYITIRAKRILAKYLSTITRPNICATDVHMARHVCLGRSLGKLVFSHLHPRTSNAS